MHPDLILLSGLIILILDVSVLDIAECVNSQRRHVDMTGEHFAPIDIRRQAVDSQRHSDPDHVRIYNFKAVLCLWTGWNLHILSGTKLIL